MTTTPTPSTADSAGREGSAECLRVLQLLHRHRGGLRRIEIATLAGLQDAAALNAVLRGLVHGGRIVATGRGTANLYVTAAHALAAGLAARLGRPADPMEA